MPKRLGPKRCTDLAAEARKVSAYAEEDEKTALWPRLTTMFKRYERYQTRTERNISLVILSPLA